MGMPKTKADCDREIASLKRDLEKEKEGMAIAKLYKNPGWKEIVAHKQSQIAQIKGKIASLQAHKKTLK
jgi:hypothetical protein